MLASGIPQMKRLGYQNANKGITMYMTHEPSQSYSSVLMYLFVQIYNSGTTMLSKNITASML